MVKIAMKLHGAKELEAALRALPKGLTKGVVERALIKAGKPIAADAQGRAPSKTGNLRSKIGVTARLSRRQKKGRMKDKGIAEAFIGASPARHAHLQEFGTGPRYTKSGKYTGQSPAKPFLRPAWESGWQGALDEIGEALWIEIEKTAKRLARKAAKLKG